MSALEASHGLLQQKARALESEVQRRVMVERALAERDRELSDFLENALEGLLKIGPEGTVSWVNGAGLELLGCRKGDCVGRSIEDFHLDARDAQESLRRLHAGETLRNHSTVLLRADGSVRHVRITANAQWDAGRLIHSRWYIRDDTHERLAQDARAHLAAIVESSDDAIVSKTLEGTVRSWNGAAERLFGYTAEEAVGRPITLIIPPERVQEESEILEKLSRGERIEHFETVRVAKSGRRIDVALTISPIRNAAGVIVGASKIARDISERKAYEQAQERAIGELKRAEEALREADRRKDEFLAVLAHELRNPLAPIRYAIAWAKKEGRGEAGRLQAQAIIERQVEQMSRLLDDLLDVSRITRGTLLLRRSSVQLSAALAAAQESARPLLEAKGHTLVLKVPEPVRLVADPVRLAQVLANLLVNAAKYTDTGGRIELEAHREQDDLVVAVRDNGIGISADMMPRLFTLFAQASPALERAEGGLGIGLSLVRGLVELHGGTITAHSEGAGYGAEFIVRLPIGEPVGTEPNGEPHRAPASPPALPLCVVVADDNRDSAASCAALLESCGHQVSVAHSGREAFELACTLRPNVLVLDIGMPELNGYQVAERVRGGTDWGRAATLIAITGWGQEQDKRRALEAGFDHHLTKPIDPNNLEGLLRAAAVHQPVEQP